MAGYSGTPLVKKLGIKPGARVALINAPKGFEKELQGLPDEVRLTSSLRAGTKHDVILFFPKSMADHGARFAKAAKTLDGAGGLWVCWPKMASGIETDLSENPIRDLGLDAGLVDNKVCAVNDVYSGLRFVRRVADRKKPVAKKRG